MINDDLNALWRRNGHVSESVGDRVERMASGNFDVVATPWSEMNRQLALQPGTITLLCGDPGASKSLMLMQMFAHLHNKGVKVGLYELEKDRAFHLLRYLAQLSGESGVTNPEWAVANPNEMAGIYDKHRLSLDQMGARIWDAPTKVVSYDDLILWMWHSRHEGIRVFGVDPITACATNDRPWEADKRFIERAARLVSETGTSLVMVTHPKKGSSGKVDLDDIAGGAGWGRFVDTVWWLQYIDEEEFTVRTPFGSAVVACNRVLKVSKGRLGPGHKCRIGMNFDKEFLTLREEGLIAE